MTTDSERDSAPRRSTAAATPFAKSAPDVVTTKGTADLDLVSLTGFLHELADRSGRAILPYFRAHGYVENKSRDDFDPVTAADRAAETVIRELISERFPDHVIVGEEFGGEARAGAPRWIIDPIDGTRAFISGVPTWGTLIAFAGSDRNDGTPATGQASPPPILGLMNQPFTQERFWCDGVKSYYRGPDGERTLKTRTCATLEDALMATTSPHLFDDNGEMAGFMAVRDRVCMTRYGTDCYAYAMVAAGQIDLVIEAGLSSYDIAALIPLIDCAGGYVTSWTGTPCHEGGTVVAAGDPRLHAQAVALLKAHLS